MKATEEELIEIATKILSLAKNFDKIYKHLENLKKFNSDLINKIANMQKQ